MTKFDAAWAEAHEAARAELEAKGMYSEADEHSSCGVGLVVATAELTDVTVPPHVRLALVRDARAVAHTPRGDGHDRLVVEAVHAARNGLGLVVLWVNPHLP